MWPFKKKHLKTYKIKWHYLQYSSFAPGADIVEAVSLAKAWEKVRRMHAAYQIGMTSWEILEEVKND